MGLRMRAWLLLAMTMGLPARLSAQDREDLEIEDMATMDLDELLNVPIVSATQTEMRLVDAPSVITVLTRQDLMERGYQSIGEALQHVVGFYVVDDHILPNVAVRGVSGGLRSESGLLKVLVDSRPVPFRPTGGNWLGVELVPLSAVERVEILRGPASAVYGADAFLGVINIITRKGEDIQGADATATGQMVYNNPGGGFDMAAGGRNGKIDYLVSGRYLYEDYSGLKLPNSSPAPRVPDYNNGRRTSRGLERESYASLTTVRYHISEEHSVYVSAYASALERGAEFSDWSQLTQPRDAAGRTSDNHVALGSANVSLGTDLKLSKSWTMGAQATAFYGAPLPSDRTEVGSSVYYVKRKFDSRGIDAQLSTSWTWERLSLSAAAGGIIDDQQLPSTEQVLKLPVAGQQPGDIRSDTSVQQGRKVFWNPGARIQATYRPFEKVPLDLTGGGRYDYHSIYGQRITGRAGVVYSPTERLNFKLLYGSAFKAPSTLLLYGVPLRPGDIQGNPKLEPQFIRTAEFFATVLPFSWLTASSGVALSHVTNKTEFLQREGNLEARNVAELNSVSWESELTASYQKWLSVYGNFAYTRARRATGLSGYQEQLLGVEATAYPSYVVNGGLRLRPFAGLSVVNELSWVSKRLASDNNILENGSVYRLPARAQWDANVRYTTAGLFSDERESAITFRARNILGETGPEPGYGGADYPLAPRTFFLMVSQQF